MFSSFVLDGSCLSRSLPTERGSKNKKTGDYHSLLLWWLTRPLKLNILKESAKIHFSIQSCCHLVVIKCKNSNQWIRIIMESFHQQLKQVILDFSQAFGPLILQPLFQKSVEKWFLKSGSTNSDFFFWSTTFLEPEKSWIYGIKPSFFLVNHFSRTRFLEPYFSNHISRTAKIEGEE